MKIAMIGSRGIGSNYGGIERVLDELCPRLADLGHQIDVFSRPDVDFAGYPGVRAIATRSLKGKHFENLSRAVAALTRACGCYDIVHFHAVGPGILSSLTRVLNQRSVVTVHALDHQRDKWGTVARLCLRAAERAITAHADRVTVVSAPLQRYLTERYAFNAVAIPNGVPAKQKAPPGALLKVHGLQPRKYLLFASRLTPEKGCHDLIAAFNAVTDARGFRLVIAGGTASPAYIASLQAQADPVRTCFVGHLAGTELAEIFSNAYAFVLPSYLEGMSMALLEALAYKLPVLVSDIPENRAVMADCGCYFSPRNVTDLQHALERMIGSPTYAVELIGRMANLPSTDWETIAYRYDNVYRSVTKMPALSPNALLSVNA
jgi:glycosyltransferase involved in cell wall biosynthesis